MLTAGEDPRFIARRLIVCAAEDVGLADPNAMNIAINAYKAVELIGLPEGRIPLANAVVYVANAPKSNKVITAIDSALADIESGLDFPPPMHLRDAHYSDAKKDITEEHLLLLTSLQVQGSQRVYVGAADEDGAAVCSIALLDETADSHSAASFQG